MPTTRIPQTIPEFNQYIVNTDKYLLLGTPTNRQRLGLTTQNGTDWTTHRTKWEGFYAQYSDPSQRTTVVIAEVKNTMKLFRAFASPLLNIIAASPNVTTADAEVFNVAIERKKPTHHTEPIAELCNTSMSMIGGGEVKLSCRTAADSSRASLPGLADSVQIAYKVGDTPPANVNDGTTRETHSKASFLLTLGADNAGKKIYLFARWYNTKHPELAGPWSGMKTEVIA